MALYLGSSKVKINLGGESYQLNLIPEKLILNGIALVSLDNYMLKDSNGLYLTVKESD